MNNSKILLNDALSQMQQILGEILIDDTSDQDNHLFKDQNLFSSSEQEKEINLDKYVKMLNNKYNKVLKILENEENLMQKRKTENEQYKSILASTISHNVKILLKYGSDTVGPSNQPQINNNTNMNDNHNNNNTQQNKLSQSPPKQFIQKQIQEKNLQNQKLEEQIKQNQDESNQYQHQIEQLNSRVQSLQNILQEIDFQQNQKNENYDQVNQQFQQKMSELISNQNELNLQIQKLKQQTSQKYKIQQQYKTLESDHEKVKSDFQAAQKKLEVSISKLMQLISLQDKLKEELSNKNDELLLFRDKNQLLEEQSKQLIQIELQLQLQYDIKNKLLTQRSLIDQEFQRIDKNNSLNKKLEVLLNYEPLIQGQSLQSTNSKNSSFFKSEQKSQQNNNGSQIQLKSDSIFSQQQTYSTGAQQQQQQKDPQNLIVKATNQISEKDQVIEIQRMALTQMIEIKNKLQLEFNLIEKQKQQDIQKIHLLEFEMEELAGMFDELDKSLANGLKQDDEEEII